MSISLLIIFNDIFLYNAMKPETLFCLWMGPKYLLWPRFGSLPNFIDHLTINDFFCQHFFRLFESFLCPNGILMDGLDITREKVIATFQPIIAWYILCKFWISYPYLTTHGTLFISFQLLQFVIENVFSVKKVVEFQGESGKIKIIFLSKWS